MSQNTHYKNPTSNYERMILALIDEQRQNIQFGKISLEINIRGGKICSAEITTIKKSIDLTNA